MDIPVYMLTGFLESGKTKFAQEILEDERFNTGEKTLYLLCEEGVEELDPSKFYGKNVTIKPVENVEDLTAENLTNWLKDINGERVLIEYNGMWQLANLFENLPENWQVCQTFTFADYNNFEMLNQNMRSLVFERIANADMMVFNRVKRDFDMQKLHQIVRVANAKIDIMYEFEDGESVYDDIKDPLPYDLEADSFEITDDNFAVFFRDITEETNAYNGKTITFKGICAVDKKMGKNTFAIGRHIMMCCEEDIQYYCLVAVTKKPVTNLKSRDWVKITATVKLEKHKAYGGVGPVFYVSSIERAEPANPAVATF